MNLSDETAAAAAAYAAIRLSTLMIFTTRTSQSRCQRDMLECRLAAATAYLTHTGRLYCAVQ